MLKPALTPFALVICALMLVAAGCGGDDEPANSGEAPEPAPSASSFPKPEGSIDDLISSVGQTNEIAAAPSEGAFSPGQERFGFALFDVAGPQIKDAEVAIYLQRSPEDPLQGPYPARVESLAVQAPYRADSADETDVDTVYVADVELDQPGDWRAAAVVRDSAGELAATNFTTSITVRNYPQIPAPGEPAPKIDTPTTDDVADVADIDTRVPPSTLHQDNLADVLGKEPVVLLFATPRLCQTRVCGPVVDVAEQVKAEYNDDAAFIHMEIYRDNIFDPEDPNNLRPQVEAFGLFTEPWLFVIDKKGNVSTRIEGAFSVNELEEALGKVVRQPSPDG